MGDKPMTSRKHANNEKNLLKTVSLHVYDHYII